LDGIGDNSDIDKDGDGVNNNLDAFPTNPSEWTDTDGDGRGDNSDSDIDGDGHANNRDAFPLDRTEWSDLDNDGIGDNADPDRDGDGYNNDDDAFPNDATESRDTDRDGYGDNRDKFPNNPTEWNDTDGDGVGDNSDDFPNDPTRHTDIDSDNDGVKDKDDAFPYDSTEWRDSDHDGVGDNGDRFPNDPTEQYDTDNDGVGDNADRFPNDSSETHDRDNDGIGDNRDPDIDGDGHANGDDAFPKDGTEWLDTDGDGIGNNSDSDIDGDHINNAEDAFPLDPLEWLDTDHDGRGNNSDPDIDGDGYANNDDAFPLDENEWRDTDNDGIGDQSDADIDGDGRLNALDDFPFDPTEWKDTDHDGIGDNSDPDIDNDGYSNNIDAFPFNASEWLDTDLDGIGNNSDPDIDGDGIPNWQDAFPLNPTEWYDSDGDGIGDNSDPDADPDGDGVANEQDPDPLDAHQTAYPTFLTGLFAVQRPVDYIADLERLVAAGDYEGDGDTDALYITTSNQIMLLNNDGDGEFTRLHLFNMYFDIDAFNAVDFDQDNDLDFVLTFTNNASVYLMENKGSHIFEEKILIHETAPTINQFRFADMDRDGKLDILRLINNRELWLYYQGYNTVVEQRQLVSATEIFDFEATDLDGNQWLDIVYTDNFNLDLLAVEQRSEGEFTHSVLHESLYEDSYVSLNDLEADGDMDILINSKYSIDVVRNNRMVSFDLDDIVNRYSSSVKMHSIDIEGDGDKDLFGAMVDSQTGQWFVLNSENQWQPSVQTVSTTTAVLSYLVADFDGDGDADTLIQSTAMKINLFENAQHNVYYQVERRRTEFKITAEDVDSSAIIYQLGNSHDEALFEIDAITGRFRFKYTPYYTTSSASQREIEIFAREGNSVSSKIVTVLILPDKDLDGISDSEDSDKDGDGVVNQDDSFPMNPYRW